MTKLGLQDDADFKRPFDARVWPALRAKLAALFLTRSRQHWCDLLEGSDACFAPVLTPAEAMQHPHMAARAVYQERDGVLQAAPAPRFSAAENAEPGRVPRRGEHGADILREAGFDAGDIALLMPIGK